MNSQPVASHLSIVIIHIALAMGVLIFGGVIYWQHSPGSMSQLELLTMMGFAVAAGAVLARSVVPPLLANAKVAQVARRDTADPEEDRRNLLGAYQASAIIAAALLEAPAFFNIFAYMMEQNPLSLVVAGALAAAILASIPSSGALDNWLENKLRAVREQRVGL